MQEARLSSAIENIVTTADEVYCTREDKAATNDPAAKEVLHYQQALCHGIEAIQNRPFSTLFSEIVSILKSESMWLRTEAGARLSDGPGGTLYTPPEGELVIREEIGDPQRFLENENNMEALIKMALARSQFEAIHLFSDGNG